MNGSHGSQQNSENSVLASMLKDRLSGRVKHGTNPGAVPYLTSDEEDELATFLIQVSEIGNEKRGDNDCPAGCREKKVIHWLISWGRMVASIYGMSSKTLPANCWSDIVSQSKCIDRRKYEGLIWLAREYFDRPWSTEQTSVYLYHGWKWNATWREAAEWVAKKGMKEVHSQSLGDKFQITLIACGNTAGTVLPPMLIFKGRGAIESWIDRWWSPEYSLWDV